MGGKQVGQSNQEKHQDRLAMVGQLTAGVVHDLRNMLCTMGLNLERAEMMMSDDKAGESLGRVQHILNNMDSLLETVVDFSRNSRRHQRFEVNQWVEDTLNMIRPTAKGARVKLMVEYSEEVYVDGVANELRQVLCNLLINACQAMKGREGSVARVRVSKVGDEVSIEVEDNGPGISDDEKIAVFSPFHTTKETGTGLGLWNCQRIVTEHGGEVRLEDGAAGGARFVMTLPGLAQAVAC